MHTCLYAPSMIFACLLCVNHIHSLQGWPLGVLFFSCYYKLWSFLPIVFVTWLPLCLVYKKMLDFGNYFETHYLTIVLTITSEFFPFDYLRVSADNDYIISPFQWLYLPLPNSFSNLFHWQDILEMTANIFILLLALTEIQSTVLSKEHSIWF